MPQVSELRRNSPLAGAIVDAASGGDQDILLIVGGGGMASVYSAGILAGFQSLGLSGAFRHIVGVSGGSINSAFFCAGQAQLLQSLYGSEFINFIVPFKPWRLYDMEAAEASITRYLSLNAVMNFPASFHVVAANLTSTRSVLLDVKAVGVIKAVMASSTPPLGKGAFVRLGDEKFADGEAICPLPIREAYEMFFPRRVLIVLNRPYGCTNLSLEFWQRNLVEMFLSIAAPEMRSYYRNWEANYLRNFSSVEGLALKGVDIEFVSPKKGISELCRDTDTLDQTFRSAFSSVRNVFI